MEKFEPGTLVEWHKKATELLAKVEANPDYPAVIQAVEANQPLPSDVLADLRLIQTLQQCTELVSAYIQPES